MNFKKIFLLLLVFLNTFNSFSQAVDPPPGVPTNKFVYVAGVLAVFFVFYFLKTKKYINEKNPNL